MHKIQNPFTPTFGIVPLHLAGRTDILNNMADAFDSEIGNPYLSSIFIGPRGSGKTALLSCLAQEASQHAWISVTVVAAPGMLEDILQRTLEAAAEFVESKPRKQLTGIEVAQLLGIEWTVDATEQGNWRTRMGALLSQLNQKSIGLLICVDEVNADVDEMVQLAATYQLFIGEGRRVALLMAGLPKHTANLMDNKSVSFLRRARQQYLNPIPDTEIERAFVATIEDAGKTIISDAVGECVGAIKGNPYMMQLVGFATWENARDAKRITVEHAQRGIQQARQEFRVSVLESTYREISNGDKAFVVAMLPDTDGSTLTNVAKRMGKGTNYASTYKDRLLKRGVILETGGSTFDFAIPGFKEFLLEKEGKG